MKVIIGNDNIINFGHEAQSAIGLINHSKTKSVIEEQWKCFYPLSQIIPEHMSDAKYEFTEENMDRAVWPKF